MGTVTNGFDVRLANRPFSVFDFRALWRSTLSARVPENQKLKMVGYPTWHRIPELSYVWNTELNGLRSLWASTLGSTVWGRAP